MRRDRKSSWEGEQWIVAQKRRENERGKNRDKKIVMAKLIIHTHTHTHKPTTKTTRYWNSKKFIFLVKLLGIQSWYWPKSGSSDVVSPGDLLVNRIWFFLSTGLVAIGM
jgi:hypothetical protein